VLAQQLSPAGIAQLQALISDKQNRSPDELKIDSNLLFAARAAKNVQLGIHALNRPGIPGDSIS
jgi:hypothetical protein